MAQDVTQKQICRDAVRPALVALLEDINKLAALKTESDANGSATGAPAVQGTNSTSPTPRSRPSSPPERPRYSTAPSAPSIGAATVATNIGYLTCMRP